jgi:hypothetical protein
VPIFLERFVLPMLSAGVIAVIVLNPLKFDRYQRAGLLLVAFGLACFAARTVQLENRPPQPPQGDGPTATGAVTVSGNCNGANTGNGGKVDVNCAEKDTGKAK